MHKTQVFMAPEGDHYRTRLTHSLEVAQIARSMARILGLEEDLTEALALAHDLGHAPFGHAGERALAACMASHGGFDHNAQSLKLVTQLECRYAAFDGLNLTWETLEGLVKHNGPLHGAGPKETEGEGSKPVPEAIRAYNRRHDLALSSHAGPEAQIAALADDIAYNAHDLDDGVRSGLLDMAEIEQLDLVQAAMPGPDAQGTMLEPARLVHETMRRLITLMIDDVLVETGRRLQQLAPQDAAAIRANGEPVVAVSVSMQGRVEEVNRFLFARLYRNPAISAVVARAERVTGDLFAYYLDQPDRMPGTWREGLDKLDHGAIARRVCDFIAGMTDRFALREHQRLFDAGPEFG
jgi:dGTPase